MRDFGYDVSDHCAVDPMFGTLEDFDALLERAHALGLKVVIDQVYSHTSDQHAWFAQSRESRDNARADWYVWADAKPDGSPPTNWLSAFGGPAWTWDARRGQYYLHNFLASQPDLNLHEREVQDALLDVARYWLERGVDGLRLDAINFALHDPLLRDNPPAPPGLRRETRPWYMQEKKYSMNQDGVVGFLERLRALTDGYGDVLTVAEVGGDNALPVMQAYTAGDNRLCTAYGFDLLVLDRPDAAAIQSALEAWPNADGAGWPSWALSNHDAPRIVSRWQTGTSEAYRARLFALLQFSLRGNVFVYQGEELGLPQSELGFDQLCDPEAIANWPHSLGRDGARTPMPWQDDVPYAGFSGGSPWLPVDCRHAALAVSRQNADPASVLNFFRRLIGLRRETPALRIGDAHYLDAPPGVLAFERRAGEEHVACVFNLDRTAAAWLPPEAESRRIAVSVGFGNRHAELPGTLPPFSGYLAFRRAPAA
jgi:alpha-glucosidase